MWLAGFHDKKWQIVPQSTALYGMDSFRCDVVPAGITYSIGLTA